ncbi:MAG: hypothetical protein P9X24_06370 [Candidatus Hatepunaea meridiana]|nr:hypothetical protein [Candidatus Hatepunaea meridiana]
MIRKSKKITRIKAPIKNFKIAEEMMRRPMPKPTTDMGSKTKYARKAKFKKDWTGEI